MGVYAVILAAGKGSRMQCDDLPKCANKIVDKPMVKCVYDSLKKINIDEIICVVGFQKEKIKEILKDDCLYAVQDEQKGTGHAVNTAKDLLYLKKGKTIITAGDMPLISSVTFENLLKKYDDTSSDLTILTAYQDNPYGYGRIVRNENGDVEKVVEEKDATLKQKKINEVNAAVYVVNNKILFSLLNEIESTNSQNEYYLTDIVEIANRKKLKVSSYVLENNFEMQGVNTKEQLDALNSEIRKMISNKSLNW